MRIQFAIGKDRGGGRRFQSVRTVDVTDWSIRTPNPHALVFRPAWATFGRRLGWTLLAAIIIGGFGYPMGMFGGAPAAPPPVPSAQERADLERLEAEIDELASEVLSQEEIAAIKARSEYRTTQARAELEHTKTAGATVFWALAALIALMGLVPPLACLWQRSALTADPHGLLVLRTRTLFPHVWSWPLDGFDHLLVHYDEVWHRTRRSRYFVGWRWDIHLYAAIAPGGESVPAIAISPHLDKRDPRGLIRMPERVEQVAQWLSTHTGVPVGQPGLGAQAQAGRSRTFTHVEGAPAFSQTYQSLDDMPPDIRRRAEEMMRRGAPGQTTFREERVVIRDHTGAVQEYTSLDDMPPDIRARFEEARRRSQEGQ